MYTVKPNGYDPVAAICSDWVMISKRALMGSNQKALAHSEGERIGTSAGIARAMAWFLTVRRVERYGKWDYVSTVDQHDCEKFLRDYVTAHDKCYGDLPANVNAEGYDDLKAEADLKFEDWYAAALSNLTYPHDMEANELERHKKAVLKKEEPATPEDEAWMVRDLEEASKYTDSLRNLYESIPTQS